MADWHSGRKISADTDNAEKQTMQAVVCTKPDWAVTSESVLLLFLLL